MKTKYDTWEIEKLEAEVRRHNYLYFVERAPEIPDVEFDKMVEALRRKAPESPALVEIASDVVTRATVRHVRPMLSLDKCYDYETLNTWGEKFSDGFVASPKIDGVAMSLRYDATGKLVAAATRGDGRVGEEITANAKYVKTIPQQTTLREVEVRGEVHLPLSVFRQQFAEAFANPRNLAAGAIKQKEASKTAEYHLVFKAYDLLGAETATEVEKRELLERSGFHTVEWIQAKTSAELQAVCERFLAHREANDFETDGVVIKANELREQERVGSTAHHPRFAIAYKYQGDSSLSTILAIEWSVSRSGTITPVALIDPVVLSGATVSRVSLHNYGLAKQLGVGIDARVVAMRRGGVIPHIESVEKPGKAVLAPPSKCPSCGNPVRVDGDFIFCSTPDACGITRVGMLKHFVNEIDCEGFGPKILEQLLEHGLVNDPADLYRLTVTDLVELERMGEVLAQKLVDHIQHRRELPLDVFLRALGISELARQTSRVLAGFGSLKNIQQVTQEELEAIHGIGPNIATAVIAGLKARKPLIDKLLRYVTILPPERAKAGVLSGKTFLFTGSLATLQRSAAQKLVEEQGGRLASGVSKTLDYLVVGDEAGSKLKKAQKLIDEGAALKILSEQEFLDIIK